MGKILLYAVLFTLASCVTAPGKAARKVVVQKVNTGVSKALTQYCQATDDESRARLAAQINARLDFAGEVRVTRCPGD